MILVFITFSFYLLEFSLFLLDFMINLLSLHREELPFFSLLSFLHIFHEDFQSFLIIVQLIMLPLFLHKQSSPVCFYLPHIFHTFLTYLVVRLQASHCVRSLSSLKLLLYFELFVEGDFFSEICYCSWFEFLKFQHVCWTFVPFQRMDSLCLLMFGYMISFGSFVPLRECIKSRLYWCDLLVNVS